MVMKIVGIYGPNSNTNYNLITKYTYVNIFVNHAVFTMFQFLCSDNGNNVAARCI